MDQGLISRRDVVPIVVFHGLCYAKHCSRCHSLSKDFDKDFVYLRSDIFKSPLICAFTTINSKRLKFFLDDLASCVRLFQSHVYHHLILLNRYCSWCSGSKTIDKIFPFIPTTDPLGTVL